LREKVRGRRRRRKIDLIDLQARGSCGKQEKLRT